MVATFQICIAIAFCYDILCALQVDRSRHVPNIIDSHKEALTLRTERCIEYTSPLASRQVMPCPERNQFAQVGMNVTIRKADSVCKSLTSRQVTPSPKRNQFMFMNIIICNVYLREAIILFNYSSMGGVYLTLEFTGGWCLLE